MEIKISITKQNKEEILRLIDQLVEWEDKGITAELADRKPFRSTKLSTFTDTGALARIPQVENVTFVEPKIKSSEFGAWGMFNSFVPGKAALRILIDSVNRKQGKPIKFSDLVDECMTHFSRYGLYKYRGFPKRISDNARSRLAMHLIMPYNDMGLIRAYDDEKDHSVMVTRDGFHFSKIQNPLLDGRAKARYLSEEESIWLIKHLKRIEEQGYKEFSVMRSLTEFLVNKDVDFEDIVSWFKDNQAFVNWLRKGSRHRDDPKAFSKQLDNVARTFTSGKIALLRELGIVSDSRATYKVLRNLEEE